MEQSHDDVPLKDNISAAITNDVEQCLNAFDRHLESERGCAPGTRAHYLGEARCFLVDVFPDLTISSRGVLRNSASKIGILEIQRQAEGIGDFRHARGREGAGRWASEAGMVQRTHLESEKDRIPREAGFGRGDADIRGIIALDVGRVCPDDHGNHQRLAVNRVAGDYQDGTAASLLAALDRVKRGEIDLAAANHASGHPGPLRRIH